MTSTILPTYLGQGLAAARPVTPLIASGTMAFYYATDTAVLSAYANGAWQNAGGYNPGTPPVVVQSASSVAGTAGLVMGAAPTNGNLLVAIAINPAVDTAGAGWTKGPGEGTTGTDFAAVFTKTAGAGESTTQSPLNSSPGGTGALVIWELSGAATGIITAKSDNEQSGLAITGHAFPNVINCICLSAAGLVSAANNLVSVFNLTQDQAIKVGTSRQIIAGHSTLLTSPLAQILATVSGSGTPSWNTMTVLISA